MKKIFVFAVAAIAALSLSSCQKEVVPTDKPMQKVTLNLGFEANKTYLNKGVVYWGTTEHVQVFTDKNGIYDFATTQSKVQSASFTGEIPVGDKIKYILSVTKTTTSNMSIDEKDIISGSDIALTASQNPSMSHTYKNGAACSIMKDGDTALKNVFGLIKMNFPAYDSGQSKIYKVEITANENIAGRFAIDYTGTEPTTGGIIDNSVASKKITVTTRWSTDKYESGEIYAMLLPGTYTGFKMTVYPFASEPTGKDSYTLGESFEIEAVGNVVITRNKWIDAGAIPAVKPTTTKTKCNTPADLSATVKGTEVTFDWTTSTDAEEYVLEVYNGATLAHSTTLNSAELPYTVDAGTFAETTDYTYKVKATSASFLDSDWANGSFTTGTDGGGEGDGYPNDTDALDYGLTEPWTATIGSSTFPGYESGNEIPEAGITVDKVFYAYSGKYYGDRVQLAQCYNFDSSTYAVKMPERRYISFKINRPGTLSFVPYASKTPSIVIALVVKKSGVRSASYIYKLENVTCYNKSGDKEDYRQSFPITEAHLSGIEEAATVYIFSDANGGFNCYPITWAPASTTKASFGASAPDFNEGWTL